jgi:hypothetical protein
MRAAPGCAIRSFLPAGRLFAAALMPKVTGMQLAHLP